MKDGPDISRIAALIGDPARGNMLTELMDGRALTASELAGAAGVTAPTASAHLSKLADGGLLVMRKQGRHRYFALAGPEVAQVLEALMGLSASQGGRTRTGPRDAALREARVCYNHLAGRWGIALHRGLLARGYLQEEADKIVLTDTGTAWAKDFGVDIDALRASRTPLCRPCLDWSERRTHLGGSLSRALFSRMETLKWLTRAPDSRVVQLTPEGKAGLNALATA